MYLQPYQHADLKSRGRQYLETATIIVLGLFVAGFYLMPKFDATPMVTEAYLAPIENIEIPPETQQLEKPPAPARPTVPVESESEEIDESLTIEETEFAVFQVMDEPPPPPVNDMLFVPYDEPPEPIGGYRALQKNVVYPDIAREAEIEGRIIVKAQIGKDGQVRKTLILQGMPGTGLDESAINAVKETAWKPAYQRDKPVTVWISVPVNFRLRSKST